MGQKKNGTIIFMELIVEELKKLDHGHPKTWTTAFIQSFIPKISAAVEAECKLKNYISSENIYKADVTKKENRTSNEIEYSYSISLDVKGFRKHFANLADKTYYYGYTCNRYAIFFGSKTWQDYLSSKDVVWETKKNPEVKALILKGQTEELQEMLTLSEVIWKEISFVEEIYNKEITLDELYVPRKQEEKIEELIHNKCSIILIEGDAGYGKTTLLWNIYRKYNEQKNSYLLFFIRSSELQKKSWSKWENSIKEVVKSGLTPLVLLDTVDILLHNNEEKDLLVRVLNRLKKIGAITIGTTRREEARILTRFISGLEPQKIFLNDYNKEELSVAIEKHVVQYYKNELKLDFDRTLYQVKNAVNRGKSLFDICKKPLTLRMLFTIYAPYEIPQEINVAELYKQYWDVKITSDSRTYSAYCINEINEKQDFSNEARFIALLMLEIGRPEISFTILEDYFSFKKEFKKVEGLIQRGILRKNVNGSCHFFHQTFFEYSAANAFYHLNKSLDPIRKVSEQVFFEFNKVKEYDVFLLPIYEHLLLLGQHMFKKEVFEELMVSLDSNYTPRIQAAIYVYSLLNEGSSELENKVRKVVVKDSGNATILIDNIPNVSSSRINIFFQLLIPIWSLGIWDLQAKILNLLEVLVDLIPQLVLKLFKENNLIQDLLGHPTAKEQHLSHLKNVLNTISKLDVYDYKFVWDELKNIFLATKDASIHKEILGLLFESLVLKKQIPEFVIFVEKELIYDYSRFSKKNQKELLEPLINIWKQELTNNIITVEQLLEESVNIDNPILWRARCWAIGYFSVQLPKKTANKIFLIFKNYKKPKLLHQFRAFFIKPILLKIRSNASPMTKLLLEDFVQNLKIVLDSQSRASLNEKSFVISYVDTFEKNKFYGLTLKKLLSRVPILNSDSFWLENSIFKDKEFGETMISLFALACLSNLDTARVTKEDKITAAFYEENEKIIQTLSRVFREIAIQKDVLAGEYLIEISLRINNLRPINSLFKDILRMNEYPKEKLKKFALSVLDLAIKFSMSSKGSHQTLGIETILHLKQLNLVELPDFNKMLEIAKKLGTDEGIATYLVILLEYDLSAISNYEKAIEFASYYFDSKALSLSKKARKTFVLLKMAQTQYIENPSKLFEFIMNTYDPKSEEYMVNYIPNIIEVEIERNLSKAIELFVFFLGSENLNKLSNRKRRKLPHIFRRCGIKLFQKLNKEQLSQILDLIFEANIYADILIINSLFSDIEIYDKVSNKVSQILESPKVKIKTKKWIIKKEKNRIRDLGNKGWPELRNLLDTVY